ncbi:MULTISPECIES: plasmid partition protein [Streptomyces]|uniref:plasmid partition protein n=1 Tax=Streptomyces TaxID=1883 RepID=UPI000BEF3106|nr:plasmid partition protein [Streptomyces sp. wa1063]WTE31804.1 plasmid partition protein [Streptomyces anulatus]
MLIVNASPRTAGKTTDTAWLGHALQEHGFDVEGFDADHSKQFWDWSKAGKFSFPVHLKATARFHDEVELPAGKISLVDCGHSENHPAITDSLFKVADLVILHMAPTRADWLRVEKPPEATAFKDIVLRSSVFRADKKPPTTWVLLNRCSPSSKRHEGMTKHYAERMERKDWNVFTTVIPNVGQYAQSMNFPISGAKDTHFGDLVVEMKERGLLP